MRKTTMTGQKRNKEATRAALINAAMAVVARDGVHGTTTRKIAAEAGVGLATLHYHFETKETVLLHMISCVLDRLRGEAPPASLHREPLRERIARLVGGIWQAVHDHPEGQITLYNLTVYALSTAGADYLARHQYDKLMQMYRDDLASASDVLDGSLGIDIEPIVNFVFTSCVGTILQWLVMRDARRAEAQFAQTVTIAQGLVSAAVRANP
jgi:AcrR family transcriptional regulator